MKEIKDDYLVVQNNNFAKGVFKQTLLGQKIILATISCIEEKDEEFKKYDFNVSKLSKSLNSKNQDIINSINSLVETSIKVWADDKEKYKAYPVFACIEYDKKESKITIQLNSLIMPFLLALKQNFTSYYLYNVSNLRSMYSLRIYNILKADAFKRVVEYSVDDFKTLINCNYERINDVKRKALDVAKKEINLKTDMEIDFEFIKTGRKITSIRFYINVIVNKEQSLYDIGDTFTY